MPRPTHPLRFGVWYFVFRESIRSLFDLPRTLQARPRTHVGESGANVPQRSQTIQGWVEPAIQGHVRRPHIPRFADGVFVTFAERAPFGDIRIAVMRVGATALPAEIPPPSPPHPPL